MRICVVVTARASWSKLQPVCEALRATPDVELQIVACASALLERYGKVVDVIKSQGFSIAAECWSVYEGESLLTSAKGAGALVCSLADAARVLRCDLAVLCADRHEILAAAQAFAYQHVKIGHLQGGERSGSIDDRVRDSVTQLADYHFASTDLAKYRVVSLTGAYDRVWNTGCPSIDVAKRAQGEPPVTAHELGGSGTPIDLSQPFGMVLQHSVTNEADDARSQMEATFDGLYETKMKAVVMWPGQDAGAAAISKVIREEDLYHTVRNLPPNRFLKLLTQASVLVGNSSAGIRECSYLGVPVVNIGSRQFGRERGPNVIDVPHDAEQIAQAIEKQIAHGPYTSSSLYGRGNAGQQIAELLTNVCARTDPSPQRV